MDDTYLNRRENRWFYYFLILAGSFYIAPSVFWFDSSEFTVSAFTLGISHPTGFPLYLLLTKLFQLIPVGSIGFRTNLFSYVTGIVGFSFMYRSFELKKDNIFIKILMFILFIKIPVVFFHLQAAEVYGLNFMLFSIMFYLFVKFLQSKDKKKLYLLAFVTGISTGNHILSVMYGFFFLLLSGVVLFRQKFSERKKFFKTGFAILIFLASGMLILVYLYVRAHKNPFRNWGNPSTLKNLIIHITGSKITQNFESSLSIKNPVLLWDSLKISLNFIYDNLKLVVFLLPLPFIFKKPRKILLLLVSVFLIDLGYTVIVNPMGILDYQTLSIALSALVFCFVPFFDEIFEKSNKILKKITVYVLTGSAVVLINYKTALKNYAGDDFTTLTFLSESNQNIDFNSLLFTTSDNTSGLYLYAQGVENRRWDIIHIIPQHIVQKAYVKKLFSIHNRDNFYFPRRETELLSVSETIDSQEQAVFKLVSYNKGLRKIYWEMGIPEFEKRIAKEKITPFLSGIKKTSAFFKKVLTASTPYFQSLRVISSFAEGFGTRLIKKSNFKEGENFLKFSLILDPANYKAWNNLGVLYSMQNSFKKAKQAAEKALKIKPDYRKCLKNILKYCAYLKNKDCLLKHAHHYLLITKKRDIITLYNVALMYLFNNKEGG